MSGRKPGTWSTGWVERLRRIPVFLVTNMHMNRPARNRKVSLIVAARRFAVNGSGGVFWRGGGGLGGSGDVCFAFYEFMVH